MNSFSFIKQYLFKPRTVGAVLPSSKYLAKKMIEGIDFSTAECIAEYGPGTGVFTDKIIKEKKPETVLIILEKDTAFFDDLKIKYVGLKNVYVINDSAENIGKYLTQMKLDKIDYIVSGLPFASLPQDVSINILTEAKRFLSNNGVFITFQYTLFKRDFIEKYFKIEKITRELRNIPPAYVFKCTNSDT